MDTKQIRNTLLLALTALVWGSAFVAQSVGAEHVGPFTFLASRSYLGGIVLLPVIAAMNARSKRSSGVSLLPKSSGDKKRLLLGGISCGFFLFLASTAQQSGKSRFHHLDVCTDRSHSDTFYGPQSR
mgnify:CR=1 FL=1